MTRRVRIAAAALVALLAGASTAGGDAAGLNTANFVDIGDGVAEVLDTHALAVSTMLIGALGDEAATVRRAGLHAPPTAAAATQTLHTACPGGGEVRTRLLDADGSGDLSRGDRFGSSFEACSADGHVVSGRSEFTIEAHRFEGHVEITELAFRFHDLGSQELRWTGPARAVLCTDLQRGTESYVVTYADLAVQQRSRHMRWNFDLDVVRPPIGDTLARIEGRMSVDGLRLQLRQDEPYLIGASGFSACRPVDRQRRARRTPRDRSGPPPLRLPAVRRAQSRHNTRRGFAKQAVRHLRLRCNSTSSAPRTR